MKMMAQQLTSVHGMMEQQRDVMNQQKETIENLHEYNEKLERAAAEASNDGMDGKTVGIL